jgi:hypothetical protein
MKWVTLRIGICQEAILIWLTSIISNGFAGSWDEIFGIQVGFE